MDTINTSAARVTSGEDIALQPTSLTEGIHALATTQLLITLAAQEQGPLPPNLSNLLRGTFGAALKTISGSTIGLASPYDTLFESPLPPDAQVLRRASHVPHPFVLRPPPHEVLELHPGDELPFDLILIGQRALAFYPQILLALLELARQGLGKARVPMTLLSIETRRFDGVRESLFDARGAHGEPHAEFLPRHDDAAMGYVAARQSIEAVESLPPADASQAGSDLTIAFESPAQIIVGGRVPRDLSFETLIRTLLRRVTSLCAFHGTGPVDADFAALLRSAETVRTVHHDLQRISRTRYSGRQKRRTPQRGLIGQVRYAGDAIADFLPLLRLGERVHVGKGTGFGLGRYRLTRAQPVRTSTTTASSGDVVVSS